jgi:hypothetical protein
VCLVRDAGFLFYGCPEVFREAPHLRVLFDFLPRGGLVVIRIQGRAAEDESPIFVGFPKEAAWAISSVESLVVRPCVPVIVAKFDYVHLMILR